MGSEEFVAAIDGTIESLCFVMDVHMNLKVSFHRELFVATWILACKFSLVNLKKGIMMGMSLHEPLRA